MALVIVVAATVIGVSVNAAIAQEADGEADALAEVTEATSPTGLSDTAVKVIAVAIVTVGASWSAAYAVAKVGSAAMGAVSENPELMGRSLVFVGLAEGIAIYGLIVAIMLLGKL
jgi:V/A-type H+-transporting ATPase subunit K